jgi:serine phosphatase RsbU (regulator of sigma subunit)
MMRHTVRAIATFTGSATAALEKLNRDLAERPRLTLCTAVCVVLRDHGRDHATAEIYCAGHPLPVLSRHGSARLVGEYGQILGADSNASFEPSTVTIEPGDLLLLYSDGVPDTVGAEERFGVPRLLDAVSSASSAQQAVAGVERALASFEVGPAADDVALLAIERVAGGDAAGVADETERGSGQHETTEA